jgi:DNA-binding helix-hairpin-helix protein with protein kinase domain
MGEKALFIEHPQDDSNRPREGFQVPYTSLGKPLAMLFEKAFVEGLHEAAKRPSAAEWELALMKTMDLLIPCQNPACEQQWFVFDNSRHPTCPFCETPFQGPLPILNLYSKRGGDTYYYDEHGIVAHPIGMLYPWHADPTLVPDERLAESQRNPCAYVVLQDHWRLFNKAFRGMKDMTEDKEVPLNSLVSLSEGRQIVLSGEGGRLVQVQLVAA